MRYGMLVGVTAAVTVGIGRLVDAFTVPTTADAAVASMAFWALVVAAIRVLVDVGRWRSELLGGGTTVGTGGAATRRIAQWTLGASLLLGACATPDETPGVEYLGTIGATEVATNDAAEIESTAPTVTTSPSGSTLLERPTTSDVPASTRVEPGEATEPIAIEPSTRSDADAAELGPATESPDTESADDAAVSPAPARVPIAHIVEPGEHLWGIAEATAIERLPADQVTPAVVASYWVEVLAMNRGQLVTTDPDLIHPGEIVMLPPIDVVAADG